MKEQIKIPIHVRYGERDASASGNSGVGSGVFTTVPVEDAIFPILFSVFIYYGFVLPN